MIKIFQSTVGKKVYAVEPDFEQCHIDERDQINSIFRNMDMSEEKKYESYGEYTFHHKYVTVNVYYYEYTYIEIIKNPKLDRKKFNLWIKDFENHFKDVCDSKLLYVTFKGEII